MVFSPTESATETSPINPQAQSEGNIVGAQPINSAAPTQFPRVYTSSTPMATHAQGNYMTGFPVGWDPTTGFGMPQSIWCHLQQGNQAHRLHSR